MTTPTFLTIADQLKYGDLQMAAEAFLVDAQSKPLTGDLYKQALIDGNDHASKFTQTQAEEFEKHWTVVDQRANTPTGFSGTLFKCIQDDPMTGAKAGEVVMSLRSTEFIDDAAHDNQATNVMEIAKTGFAWGQIRDMEAWYADLILTGKITWPFSVTGYSLGGHLATAFNTLHPGMAEKVVTFNGAGIGGIDSNASLRGLVNDFARLSSNTSGTEFQFDDANVADIYARARTAINAPDHTGTIDAADSQLLYDMVLNSATPLQTQRQAQMVLDAVNRINTIRAEIVRLDGLSNGEEDRKSPLHVDNGDVAQLNLDYQMAVKNGVRSCIQANSRVRGSAWYEGLVIKHFRSFSGFLHLIYLVEIFEFTIT